jgi:hypothetical protein
LKAMGVGEPLRRRIGAPAFAAFWQRQTAQDWVSARCGRRILSCSPSTDGSSTTTVGLAPGFRWCCIFPQFRAHLRCFALRLQPSS